MKNLINLFAVILSLVFFSFTPSEGSTFVSEDGFVSIEFPTEYHVDKKATDKVSRVKAQGDINNQLFVISYANHYTKLVDHEEMASVSLKSFAEALNAEVTEQEEWKYKKHKGIHGWISSEKNELVGEYKVILIGQNQYQLTSVADPEYWDEKAAAKFFKSFKLSKEALQ